jgi:hypothetical protein
LACWPPASSGVTAETIVTSSPGGDNAFLPNGQSVSAVLVQPNGDIVAVGFSENNTTGVTDIALARYIG